MKRVFLGAAVALAVGAPALSQTQAPPATAAAPHDAAHRPGAPTIDDFYDPITFESAHLSPDGHHLAFVRTVNKESVIMMDDLDTGKISQIFDLNVKNTTVGSLRWKDDNRLILEVNFLELNRTGGSATGSLKSLRGGELLYAMDRDGGNGVKLPKGGVTDRIRDGHATLLDLLRQDPDHILVSAPGNNYTDAVWKVDVHTGETTMVQHDDPDTVEWGTDSTGAVTLRYREIDDDVAIEGRALGASDWSTIFRERRKDLNVRDDIEILGPAEKPGQFYVTVKSTEKTDGDQRTLQIYDVATKKFSGPIWPALKYDIDDIVHDGDSYRLAGVCYTADVLTCDLADKTSNANYTALKGYFGNDLSVFPVSTSTNGNWQLFVVSGPTEPSSYYLFDKAKAKVQLLTGRYTKLPPEQLAAVERFVYPSRDGVSIPGYLTRPINAPKGPLPLIVMPHGGPEARDSLRYDVWSQFLATRGYLVFQPNFRGSGGYGAAYAEAGYRQWNGVMANDLTDGVKRLIETGQADPSRICIFGASYGGYAALLAGAIHPELYKCVASWAGVSDLFAALRFESDHGKDNATYKYWHKTIGDPVTDEAMIKAASPVTYAATYKPPVLLIHGESDRIVDQNQSIIMSRALKAAGKDVKLITFPNEGHPEFIKEDQVIAMTDVIDFIEAHIAPAPLPATPPGPAAAAPAP